jgi:hypothetical protein
MFIKFKIKNYSNFINESLRADNLNDWHIFRERETLKKVLLLHIFPNSVLISFAHCINAGIDPSDLESGQINDPLFAVLYGHSGTTTAAGLGVGVRVVVEAGTGSAARTVVDSSELRNSN